MFRPFLLVLLPNISAIPIRSNPKNFNLRTESIVCSVTQRIFTGTKPAEEGGREEISSAMLVYICSNQSTNSTL